MQASTVTRVGVVGVKGGERADRDLAACLQKSEIYRDYQRSFEAATGLPLALRAVGSFQTPLHGSRHANPFCQLMASQNKSCAACLELQERIEVHASEKAATLECFAGLSDTAVPVRIGERVVAFLQTGQVLMRRPSNSHFSIILKRVRSWGVTTDAKALKEAYFRSQVVVRQRYESSVHLISIFAQHLSSLGNQIMVSENAAESQTITKARAFIAEHLAEEITLGEVARAAGMSIYYFCKMFKKEMGLTFTEYLARLRVETVKRMLLDPHKRISEAAYDAGFQSLSQFNRVFRHFAGETPSNFRDALHRKRAGVAEPARMTCAA
jgi:AraC-like DNA-binding protein